VHDAAALYSSSGAEQQQQPLHDASVSSAATDAATAAGLFDYSEQFQQQQQYQQPQQYEQQPQQQYQYQYQQDESLAAADSLFGSDSGDERSAATSVVLQCTASASPLMYTVVIYIAATVTTSTFAHLHCVLYTLAG
jgi:hypothetical protein